LKNQKNFCKIIIESARGKNMKRKITLFLFVLSLTSVVLFSCLQLLTNKITVQITRGTGNNYYEITIVTNSLFSPDNTNNISSFNINDTNNVTLEAATGKLSSGYASWTSSKDYLYGLYFIIIKIDKTGDDKIGVGDEYSFKYIILDTGSNSVSFYDTDTWYSLN
jgi:hypothetical protein